MARMAELEFLAPASARSYSTRADLAQMFLASLKLKGVCDERSFGEPDVEEVDTIH